MSDSENTKGHGESVPEEDPEQQPVDERPREDDAAQGTEDEGLTVEDILNTPQSEDVETAAAGSDDTDVPAQADDGEAQKLADERLEDLLRLKAEFLNYKNRTAREKEQLRDVAAADLLTVLLPVLDDIDAARKAGDLEDGPFAAIATKLEETLTRQGLVRLGEVGEVFDPNIHEAVMQQPTDEVEPDHVSMVLRSGFTMGERVVRPAQVAVAAQP